MLRKIFCVKVAKKAKSLPAHGAPPTYSLKPSRLYLATDRPVAPPAEKTLTV